MTPEGFGLLFDLYEIERVGLDWHFRCPACEKGQVTAKQLETGRFELTCSTRGCGEIEIRRVAWEELKEKQGTNGAKSPEERPPPPDPPPPKKAPDVPGQVAEVRPAIRGYTARDLQKMVLPEQRFAIPRLVPQGVTIVSGGQKVGKSRMLYDAGIAIASGGVALGCIPVEQGEVLYLCLEDNDRRLQDRLRQILGEEPAPEDLHIYPDWPPIAAGGLNEIRNWLENHKRTRMVAIDTLGAFRTGSSGRGNQGVYQEDYELGRSLLRLAIDFSIALVVAHHTNKKEDWEDWSHAVSGSVGLTGAADATLLFSRPRGSKEARLRGTGRDIEEFDLALSWDDTANIWVMIGEFEDTQKSPERFEVLELIGSNGPLPPSDVSDLLDKKLSATKMLLLRMFRDGDLTRKGGKYSIPEKKVEG